MILLWSKTRIVFYAINPSFHRVQKFLLAVLVVILVDDRTSSTCCCRFRHSIQNSTLRIILDFSPSFRCVMRIVICGSYQPIPIGNRKGFLLLLCLESLLIIQGGGLQRLQEGWDEVIWNPRDRNYRNMRSSGITTTSTIR